MKRLTTEELDELIIMGESETVEFRKSFAQINQIAKDIVAMANTSGGTIIVGVTDNFAIRGVGSSWPSTDRIFKCVDNPPTIDMYAVEIEGKKVCVISVDEIDEEFVYYDTCVYSRIGTETRLISEKQIKERISNNKIGLDHLSTAFFFQNRLLGKSLPLLNSFGRLQIFLILVMCFLIAVALFLIFHFI